MTLPPTHDIDSVVLTDAAIPALSKSLEMTGLATVATVVLEIQGGVDPETF